MLHTKTDLRKNRLQFCRHGLHAMCDCPF